MRAVAFFASLLLVAIGYAACWLWDRRWQALAGLVVMLLTIAISAARPGHLWSH